MGFVGLVFFLMVGMKSWVCLWLDRMTFLALAHTLLVFFTGPVSEESEVRTRAELCWCYTSSFCSFGCFSALLVPSRR